MKKNINILTHYLNLNDIHVDKTEFEYQLNGHPEFPNILSFSDTLHFFNIDCSVFEIDKEDVELLPENFLSINEGDFKLEDKKNYDISTSNVVLLVDKSEIFHNEKKKNNILLWSMLLLSALVLSILLIDFSFFYIGTAFLSLSFLGIFLSYEAYKKTHGKGTFIPLGVCQNKMLKTDCDYVFNYKKWKFFDISEISLLFFFSQMISFIILAIYKDLSFYYFIYKYIFYLFIPISFISLYYQVIVIKKLCPVCIGIILSVYGQLALLLFLPNSLVSVNPFSIILYLIFVLASVLFLLYLKEKISWNNKLKEEIIKSSRFKKNYAFFRNNLSIQKKTLNDDFLNSFNFGTPDSNLTLTLVTNPSCKYCKEFYPTFMRIINNYGNKVNIRLVLDADLDNFPENLRATYINLACIYENSEDKTTFFVALEEWYNIRTDKNEIDKWYNKYSHLFNNQYDVISILNNQKKWRNINDINFTPDIFINGYQYPIEYDRADLEYFISEMVG
ncbi:thioredoxin domain-containing protein [Chryseobacterium sp. Tr-659]|uniref:thioredoxin domain-containing protein n=1 Tax=Chryseobacterium sp. Tr-659 TaxID=2608340 RepID=UPI00141D8A2C|nr:thioredoxin domain-containing protein [Chryseobacterium sp. Tr-659]NIF07202.1 thioredoxin domain-containing protein [Chryseobacterium sp. Tr-659]